MVDEQEHKLFFLFSIAAAFLVLLCATTIAFSRIAVLGLVLLIVSLAIYVNSKIMSHVHVVQGVIRHEEFVWSGRPVAKVWQFKLHMKWGEPGGSPPSGTPVVTHAELSYTV